MTEYQASNIAVEGAVFQLYSGREQVNEYKQL
jgi:hypothetical protein